MYFQDFYYKMCKYHKRYSKGGTSERPNEVELCVDRFDVGPDGWYSEMVECCAPVRHAWIYWSNQCCDRLT